MCALMKHQRLDYNKRGCFIRLRNDISSLLSLTLHKFTERDEDLCKARYNTKRFTRLLYAAPLISDRVQEISEAGTPDLISIFFKAFLHLTRLELNVDFPTSFLRFRSYDLTIYIYYHHRYSNLQCFQSRQHSTNQI